MCACVCFLHILVPVLKNLGWDVSRGTAVQIGTHLMLNSNLKKKISCQVSANKFLGTFDSFSCYFGQFKSLPEDGSVAPANHG